MFYPFGPFFVMPVCYHPTTALLVDDDKSFTKTLSLELSEDVPIKSFNHPTDAIKFMRDGNIKQGFASRCYGEGGKLDLMSLRHEVYNPNRFKEIIISITDYDMPLLNGFELIQLMQFPQELQFYSHILLTGAAIPDLDKNLSKYNLKDKYLIKSDPDLSEKLLTLIKSKTESMFQWYSYPIAQAFARDKSELASVLFDFHFGIQFNHLIEEHKICELYLYDRQGSFLFLDRDGKLSWLFVRNEHGIQNSIEIAQQHHAPQRIIDAIKSREVILSLYEPEDFVNKKEIDWNQYLIPATRYTTSEQYTDIMSLEPNKNLYYAYTTDFMGHEIDTDKILSFNEFLKKSEK